MTVCLQPYTFGMPQAVGNQKQCSKCEELKLVDAFYRQATSKDGRQVHCKACRTAATKAQKERDPEAWEKRRRGYWQNYALNRERGAARRRLREYGITVEQYNTMLEAQGNLCAACRQPETRTCAAASLQLSP